METKAEKFTRLSKDRLGVAIFKIEQLTKLNTRQYESTDTQRADLIDTLDAALDGLRKAWNVPSKHTFLGTTPPPVPNPTAHPRIAEIHQGHIAPVDGHSRIEIRKALLTLVQTHGPNDPGTAALRRIVLGWSVGDGSPEDLARKEQEAAQ